MCLLPSIDHSLEGDQVSLKFSIDTPVNDILGYCRSVLEMKNAPRKRKLSLGRDYRMLMIFNEIDSCEKEKEKHEYTSQLVAREMRDRYGEKINMETVDKALGRIRKIEKEMNTDSDI